MQTRLGNHKYGYEEWHKNAQIKNGPKKAM